MQLTVFDVFAGCGGLSLGLTMAGLNVVAACERDSWAAETFTLNHPSVELFKCDISELTDAMLRTRFRNKIDVIAGGPPCQGFSVSGKRQYGIYLGQNRLVWEFVRVVKAIQPRYIVMENVGGFRTATIDSKTPALDAIRSAFEALGYEVRSSVLQAADFGVPQYRTRLFLVASRFGFSSSPFPNPCHTKKPTPGYQLYRSVLDAISDLPHLGAGEGTDQFQPYTKTALNEYQVQMRNGGLGVYNHQAMKHSRRLVERFESIAPGGSGYKLNTDERLITVYKSNNQRLICNLPSLCITANFQSNYIHPLQHRNLTAREAARIMSFPDTYIFKGKRTLMSSSLLRSEGRHHENHLSQYNQIGNAVPPFLARALGLSLAGIAGLHAPARAYDLVRAQQAGLF